jgi:hypothetical protein
LATNEREVTARYRFTGEVASRTRGLRLRVFCASRRRPPRLADVLAWARRHEQALWLDRVPPVDPNRPGWREAAFRYEARKWPFLIEAKYAGEPALREEVDRFVEIVGTTRFGLRRRSVIKHLRRTRMIVSIEVPAHDADVGGNEAIEVTLDFFVANYDGLVQRNGDGF